MTLPANGFRFRMESLSFEWFLLVGFSVVQTKNVSSHTAVKNKIKDFLHRSRQQCTFFSNVPLFFQPTYYNYAQISSQNLSSKILASGWEHLRTRVYMAFLGMKATGGCQDPPHLRHTTTTNGLRQFQGPNWLIPFDATLCNKRRYEGLSPQKLPSAEKPNRQIRQNFIVKWFLRLSNIFLLLLLFLLFPCLCSLLAKKYKFDSWQLSKH